jgi:predicted ATPase with chaperone activity
LAPGKTTLRESEPFRTGCRASKITVRELLARFLADSRTRMKAGDLAPRTYAGHAKELPAFASRVMDARVSALRPEHFSRYNEILVNERKLGRHARKRTIAYIKSMLNWGASVMASISDSSKLLMRQATSELGLNGRATDRIMRIARTIADMDGSENVAELHLAEAIQYRLLDRKHWG